MTLTLIKELPNNIKNLSSVALRELQQLLNKHGYDLAVDGIIGPNTTNAFNDFKTKNKLTYPNEIGELTLEYLQKIPSVLVTLSQLEKIYIHTPRTKLPNFLTPLNNVCRKFQINTKPRITAFLAQLGHESGGFRYMEEIASGVAYEGRKDLGNTQKGDGIRFKGRGPIQITGRSNYTQLSKDTGIDFVSNPTWLTQPKYGCLASGWYWNTRNLNKYADFNTLDGFKRVTRLINGGYNGLNDRISYWNRAKSVL